MSEIDFEAHQRNLSNGSDSEDSLSDTINPQSIEQSINIDIERNTTKDTSQLVKSESFAGTTIKRKETFLSGGKLNLQNPNYKKATSISASARDLTSKDFSLDELLEAWNTDLKAKKLDLNFQQEHEKIKNPDYLKWNDSLLEYNLDKSKYQMYPYDFNRVKLATKKGVQGSDYINASFIEGYNNTKKFIAAQAPSKTTIDSFLNMIIEKKVKCIVMLCKFREDTPMKAKCYPFWNDFEEVTIGDYKITASLLDNKCSYFKRRLSIRDTVHNKVHDVEHYQYTEWPDKGVPDEADTVISIIERVNLEHSTSDWPILVFCNSGVGRTASYITLDILLETLDTVQRVNIKQLLGTLRMQRANFLDSWEQYKFIHYALLQRHVFGKTTIPKELIDLQLNKLNFFERSKNKTRMEIEYHKIGSFNDAESSRDIYNEFPKKFQSKIFLPYDDKLIEIRPNSENPLEKYIDAVSFEPSQIDVKFIIASDPADESLGDFLEMIFLRRPSIIVSLSENFYLPNLNESVKFKNFQITQTQNIIENEISIHILEFLNMENKNKVNVHYFDASSNWSEDNGCPENREIFINTIRKLLNLVDTKFNHHTGPVSAIVHSKSGDDKCGVFIASCVLFNSITVAAQVDVPKIVRQLRKSKTNMIYTFERYKFLYETCHQFIQAEKKSNFNSRE